VESNWRWNVAEIGWQGSDWELAARLDGLIPNGYVVKESPTTWGLWLFNVPLFGELAVRVNGPFTIGTGERFPFGLSVLPD